MYGYRSSNGAVEFDCRENSVILFHGAKTALDGNISIEKSKSTNDFGRGFYCAESFEACEANAVFDELNDEFGKSSYGKEKYTEHELYWIGYLYRYWCCIQDKTSKQVYKIIKPKELRELYYPYHSLDPAQAIERILEARKLNEDDFIQRGVELLRKAIKNENKKD